jgi:outer membrane protein TolC
VAFLAFSDMQAGAAQLEIADAVRYALEHNPDVIRARADVLAARAESLAAVAPLYHPEVDVDLARGGDTILRGTDWNVSVGVSKAFELSGKRAARLDVARAERIVAETRVREQERRVILAVRDAFRRLQIAGEQVGSLERRAAVDREVADATEKRVRSNVVTAFTARLARLESTRSEGALLQARTDAAALETTLRALLNTPPTERPEFLLEPLADEALGRIPSESTLVTFALAHRADLEPLRRQIAVARAQSRLASLEARPDPTVGLGIETAHQQIDGRDVQSVSGTSQNIARIENQDAQLTARITIPLPFINRNQAGRIRAEAAEAQARADLARREASVRAEVAAARDRAVRMRELLALYRRSTAHVQTDLALVRDAYRDGRINLETYLTDTGRMRDALDRLLDAAQQAAAAQTELETSVGVPLEEIAEGGAR